MIAGEFAVFMVLMGVGVFWIYKVFNKELLLSQSKKNFSLSVTHELKTPIAASKLFIETILTRDLPKEKTDELLGKVLNEQDRLQVLIDKILLSARLNNTNMKIELQKVNLFELVEQSIEKTDSAAISENNIDPSLMLSLDPFYFSSVINNLHENSVKYSPVDPKIIWSAKIINSDVLISIEDNGTGIKQEDRSKIFEMYHRTEDEETKSIQGTGLGLFLVLKMVQLHKGTIAVGASSIGGTKFEIKLANN
jgi:signal transduction histidine kinase